MRSQDRKGLKAGPAKRPNRRQSPAESSANGRIEVRSKVWLESGGKTVFSRGREMLFEAIDRHGSINRAAREMGIPYRRAWGYIRAMEERLGVTLVETRKGGPGGGGAELTSAARELLEGFRRLESGIDGIVDRRFGKEFKGGSAGKPSGSNAGRRTGGPAAK